MKPILFCAPFLAATFACKIDTSSQVKDAAAPAAPGVAITCDSDQATFAAFANRPIPTVSGGSMGKFTIYGMTTPDIRDICKFMKNILAGYQQLANSPGSPGDPVVDYYFSGSRAGNDVVPLTAAQLAAVKASALRHVTLIQDEGFTIDDLSGTKPCQESDGREVTYGMADLESGHLSLCAQYHSASYVNKCATVAHELSHAMVGTSDYGYYRLDSVYGSPGVTQPVWRDPETMKPIPSPPTADLLENADSYAGVLAGYGSCNDGTSEGEDPWSFFDDASPAAALVP